MIFRDDLYISLYLETLRSLKIHGFTTKARIKPIEPRDVNTAQRHTEIHYPKHKKKRISFTIYVNTLYTIYPRESTDLTERVY